MTTKTYGQFCAIARALDVVGERWSLLVVRELLEGPKRYGELQDGLVHVSTDMLAARLKDLEQAGVIVRRRLPGARTYAYSLTARGRDLEPVLNALARWGLEDIGPRRGETFRLPWLERAVSASIRADRPGVDLTVRFELPEGAFALHISPESVAPVDPDVARADVVVAGRVQDLAAIAADPARAADLATGGRVSIEGRAAAVRRLAGLLTRDVAPVT
jgi:DNA-binding HxlR family transcriptional regulator